MMLVFTLSPRLSSRQWHLYRDATLLLFVREPSVVPCGVSTSVGSDIQLGSSCPEAASEDKYPTVCSQPSLQLITANLTSWFSGWPQLLSDHPVSSGPCVYLVCETHLTRSSSRACVAGLHRLGLHGVFRCATSPYMSSSSGVAVISSLPLREAPWTSPSLQKLACDGRLIHATCAIAGSQPLHLVVFYGFASSTTNPSVCQQNEEVLTDITEECMSWGQVPVVLVGDFNVKIADSLSLNNLLLYGRWVDTAVEHARRCGDGLSPPPTCFKNPCSSKGTRIDGVFLSPSIAKGF